MQHALCVVVDSCATRVKPLRGHDRKIVLCDLAAIMRLTRRWKILALLCRSIQTDPEKVYLERFAALNSARTSGIGRHRKTLISTVSMYITSFQSEISTETFARVVRVSAGDSE